jgi:exosortase B
MSAVPDTSPSADTAARLRWLPVLAGLLVLYVPTVFGMAMWPWQEGEQSHSPIVLSIIIWLIWRGRAVLFATPERTAPMPGFALLTIGLLIYVVGRSQAVAPFEIGSLAPILAGVLLAMRGWSGLRAFWFPVFFVAFMVPLPGVFIDALTGPLKQYVSEATTNILHAAGYPVARNGVIIFIGQYQMLVADACSGLNSMFSLSALGVLYMYIMARARLWQNAVMLASILPIAFTANIIRVLVLILITYHFGDAAGQGFLHGAAGIVLLLVALAFLVSLDFMLMHLRKLARS